MRLEQIEAFFWVARLGSFHAAARHLRLAQPSVSARMRELERHLGALLFDRTGRAARLTPKGRELLGYAQQILALTSEVEERIGSREALVGRVRFGVTSIPAVTWMPKLIRRMAKAYPGIELEFAVDSSESMHGLLLEGELDLAFLAGPLHSPALVTHSLGRVAMGWLASPSLDLPNKQLTPVDLAEVPIITDSRTSFLHGLALEWFRRGGAEPRRHHACSSLPTRLELARLGLGLAIAPPTVVARDIADGRLRLLSTAPALPSLDYVIAIAGGTPTPAAKVLLEMTRVVLDEEPSFHISAGQQA